MGLMVLFIYALQVARWRSNRRSTVFTYAYRFALKKIASLVTYLQLELFLAE